jgi:hypothetical protein
MALELVTGYWGQAHVTAEQEADLTAGITGSNCYVLPIGEKMRAEAVTSNKVRIFDGVFLGNGREIHIDEGAYEDVSIENGTVGLLRNDMIVIKYKKDEDTGYEGATLEVLKGQSDEKATDPTPNTQDIRAGAIESEMPLYRVCLNGLAIEAIEPLYYAPKTIEELCEKYASLESKVSALTSDINGMEVQKHTLASKETVVIEQESSAIARGLLISSGVQAAGKGAFIFYLSNSVTNASFSRADILAASGLTIKNDIGKITIENTSSYTTYLYAVCFAGKLKFS